MTEKIARGGVDAGIAKAVELVRKHPVLALGGVGLGVGTTKAIVPGREEQDIIMREYLGAPGAKYSSCALMEKFAERKMVLAAKIAFEKAASDPQTFGQGVSGGASSAVGGGIISEGIAAIRRLIGLSSQAVTEKFIQEPKRKKLLNEVKEKDIHVRTGERENPGQADLAYMTMRRFAPTLSTDPAVVASFLRNAAVTGGPMDFQTIKGLAEAESAVQRAKSDGAWLKGGL